MSSSPETPKHPNFKMKKAQWIPVGVVSLVILIATVVLSVQLSGLKDSVNQEKEPVVVKADEELNTQIKSVVASVSTLDSTVGEITTAVNTNIDNISALDKQVGANIESINTHSGVINSQEERIAQLEAHIEGLTEEFNRRGHVSLVEGGLVIHDPVVGDMELVSEYLKFNDAPPEGEDGEPDGKEGDKEPDAKKKKYRKYWIQFWRPKDPNKK